MAKKYVITLLLNGEEIKRFRSKNDYQVDKASEFLKEYVKEHYGKVVVMDFKKDAYCKDTYIVATVDKMQAFSLVMLYEELTGIYDVDGSPIRFQDELTDSDGNSYTLVRKFSFDEPDGVAYYLTDSSQSKQSLKQEIVEEIGLRVKQLKTEQICLEVESVM